MKLPSLTLPEMVLTLLMVLYLFAGVPPSRPVAEFLDSMLGRAVVMVIAIVVFKHTHTLVGVLAFAVAVMLVVHASEVTGSSCKNAYYPTEAKKWSPFSPAHQFPYTLEEEIVKKMTVQAFNTEYVKAPFRPVLDDTHEAQYLTQPPL